MKTKISPIGKKTRDGIIGGGGGRNMRTKKGPKYMHINF